jgi:hypothetical protein
MREIPMSRIFLATVFLLLALNAGSGHAADSPVIATDARLEKLADGFKFTEGPAADGDGNVFFTDQPNDRILSGVATASSPLSCDLAAAPMASASMPRGISGPAPMRRTSCGASIPRVT